MPTLRAIMILGVLTACGAGPARLKLPEGRGRIELRFNPPACLASRPDLHVEVRTPHGWERVAIEPADPGTPDLAVELLERFEASPAAHLEVEAVFTAELMRFGGRHQSRTIRLLDLEPPELEE